MCAINGIVSAHERSVQEKDASRRLVQAMNAATAHRGPDGTHVWEDECATLGHNRLAIIDLSSAASQPMASASGRYQVVFNGEIYNYLNLKKELAGYPFKTQSDTEVLLAAYEKWGVSAFAKLRGMFAFALWDTQEEELVLVRDQAGVKPLFWRFEGGTFYFSSELKGLLADPTLARRINRDALESYLRLRYVPEPLTLFQGVHKLPPATVVTVKGGVVRMTEYASVPLAPLVVEGEGETLLHIESLVDAAVSMEMVSDRPVGLFLSGGLDSSIVLDAASKAAGEVETFSLRFDLGAGEQSDKFNADADIAAQTAQQYRARHHEVLFSEADFVRLLPEATQFLDQPVGNATALAQMHLARAAREHIVVALQGDGGDELFGGYPRYRFSRFMDMYQQLPGALRSVLGVVPPLRKLNVPPGAERVALFMFEKDAQLVQAVQPEFITPGPEARFEGRYLTGRGEADFTQLFMDADRRSWLPDEALIRTDLMTMAASLEARVPLLNADLVAYASRLPTALRVGQPSKRLLRKAFAARLPAHVLAARKRGFFSPIAKWLRRPALNALVKEVLSPGFHPGTDALLNYPALHKLFDGHVAGTHYAAPLLWSLVSLRLWAKEYNAVL